MKNYLKTYSFLLSLALSLTMIGCSDHDWDENSLTPEQRELIGTAVNFNATISDHFTSRTTYDHSGVFNDDDIMVIYRQYYNNDTKSFEWNTEDFHTYHFYRKYAEGTENITLGREWQVAYDSNNTSYLARLKGKYSSDGGTGRVLDKSYQTEADSITWENGKTLRYRAWSRSNQSGVLRGRTSGTYYPDFEISDWVNVSGPTNEIPLTLRHVGSRIMFSYKNMGNQLSWAEICTDAEDYERLDNANNSENDTADKTYPKTFTYSNGTQVTIDSAAEAAAKVKAVYDRMCIPAGVNIEDGTLRSMTKTAYEAAAADAAKGTGFSKIEEWEFDDTKKSNLVEFNSLTPTQITDTVQRPVFTGSVNTHLHLITIPYDMSNSETSGEILRLPPWTRIKVWLYDVNNGDKSSSPGRESEYHILAIDDIKKDNEVVYPDGLEMRPGYSYEFVVGYRYNTLTITPGENTSWIAQDEAIQGEASSDTQTTPAARSYSWWKQAISDAIPKGNEAYRPEFHINTVEEFLEFIKLVNGDAADYGKNHKIYRLVKEWTTTTNSNGTISKTPKTYGWSRVNSEQNPEWVDKADLEAEGFVFYEHYFPADGDKAAYSVEDYLQAPYNFYDAKLERPFTVYLESDIDFKDIKIQPVGKTKDLAFRGYFEGYHDNAIHTISNLNVEDGYLFGYVQDSAIRNLRIESYHTVGLLNEANPSIDSDGKVTGWGCNIVGISVKANNTTTGHNAIAKQLTGLSYVVGCIHEGDASGALVGSADNMTMYGCMRTASNISGGALLGAYTDVNNKYLAPNSAYTAKVYNKKPSWSRFMCNYYNKDIREDSKNATAIGSEADNYSVWYYIRGCASRILRAQNDNLVGKKVSLGELNQQQVAEFYGLAPWKAMNYAIYKYNTDANYPGKNGHTCHVQYQVSSVGYDHTYPQLISGEPENYDQWNVISQTN